MNLAEVTKEAGKEVGVGFISSLSDLIITGLIAAASLLGGKHLGQAAERAVRNKKESGGQPTTTPDESSREPSTMEASRVPWSMRDEEIYHSCLTQVIAEWTRQALAEERNGDASFAVWIARKAKLTIQFLENLDSYNKHRVRNAFDEQPQRSDRIAEMHNGFATIDLLRIGGREPDDEEILRWIESSYVISEIIVYPENRLAHVFKTEVGRVLMSAANNHNRRVKSKIKTRQQSLGDEKQAQLNARSAYLGRKPKPRRKPKHAWKQTVTSAASRPFRKIGRILVP